MGRPILCLTTTHPSHNDTASSSTSQTLGSGGGSMTLACPLTGSFLSSLRVTGDLAGKVPIGMHSLSLFPQDFCTATNSGHNNNSNTTTPQQLAMAYGWSSSSNNSNNNNKEDSYAMLLTIRRQTATSGTSDASAAASSLPPIVHWKCRIPEANLTAGLLVSTCGLYIVGGGASGNLYVWKSVGGGADGIGGGQLIRTIPKAHYRSITTMTWQNSSSLAAASSYSRANVNTSTSLYLVTGGADGMVHVFSLVDLVSNTNDATSSCSSTIYPLCTWSRHHMPVTAVGSLGDRRLVTTSLDGQVLLLDLSASSSSSSTITEPSSSGTNTYSSNSSGGSGGKVLAALQLPHGIQSLVMDPQTQTLYAGSVQGTIYIIAWDEYAIYQVQQQQGVHVILSPPDSSSGGGNKRQKQKSSMSQQVFGGGGANYRKNDQQLQDSKSYQTELSGHNRSVTSLALVNATAASSDTVLLCSGDEGGTLRIWDTTSRGCIHVVNPWSTNNNTTSTNAAAAVAAAKAGSKPAAATIKKRHHHPITSIRVIVEDTPESTMATSARSFGMAAVATTNSNIMRGDKNTTSVVNLVTPLQKFATTTTSNDHQAEPTLLLRPSSAQTKSLGGSSLFWDVARDSSRQRLVRKRQLRRQQEENAKQGRVVQQQQQKQPRENEEDYRAKAVALQKELDKAQATIQRWEAVNNKLMAQLQK